jgi:pimeloyl-ACP methyl ester carboxylesterase
MAFFNYKEKNIHYLSEGLGPVIVLLHGYLENLSMWDEMVEKLAKTNQVVRIDFPGFGKSECIEHENGMALYAEITAQLLALLNIDKYALIGHSMGGYVALELASSYPKKTSQLILFHSTALADSEEKKNNAKQSPESPFKEECVFKNSN